MQDQKLEWLAQRYSSDPALKHGVALNLIYCIYQDLCLINIEDNPVRESAVICSMCQCRLLVQIQSDTAVQTVDNKSPINVFFFSQPVKLFL